MRYSFHGKVRSSGQPLDGFVEANDSEEAIDRLADQGIIGVYSVRADPLPARNSIVLSGDDQSRGQLEQSTGPEVVLTQLVDKLTTLVGQVERLLSRPMAMGPARGGEGSSRIRPSNHPSESQNATLQAIFQTNLDLRRSLERLAGIAPLRTGDNGHNGNSAAMATIAPVARETDSHMPTSRDTPVPPPAPMKTREPSASPMMKMQAQSVA